MKTRKKKPECFYKKFLFLPDLLVLFKNRKIIKGENITIMISGSKPSYLAT